MHYNMLHHKPTLTLSLLLLCMSLSACASYGFSDREEETSSALTPVTLGQIRADASRQLDVRLATAHMATALERCGLSPQVSDAGEGVAHMACRADSSRSRGAGHALWADITLFCTVSRGPDSHPLTLHAQRMITPHELGSRQLALAQHTSDTDALLDAIAHLDCPLLDGAPLGPKTILQ